MSRNGKIIVGAIVALIIGLLFFGFSSCGKSNKIPFVDSKEGIKYTLYISAIDATTGSQLLPTELLGSKIEDILLKNVSAYTGYTGNGASKNEKGETVKGVTLIYVIDNCKDEEIEKAVKEISETLNLGTVFVEKTNAVSGLYTRK